MSKAWTTNPSLLNPRFESYQLSTSPVDVTTVPLPAETSAAPTGRVLQQSRDSNTVIAQDDDSTLTLGWREAKHRASFNHLFAVSHGLAWIDAAARIWLVSATAQQGLSQPENMATIPSVNEIAHGQYASILQLEERPEWLVNDGTGSIHLFDSQTRTFVRKATLMLEEDKVTPFNLHAAASNASGSTDLVLSFAAPKDEPHRRIRLAYAVFDVRNDVLEVKSVLGGNEYPALVSIDAAQRSMDVVAGSPFESLDKESTPDGHKEEKEESPRSQAPSFSWTQDREAVTLSFPLPENLRSAPPKDVKVVFTPQFLNIHSPSHPALSLSHRKLWAPVNTHLSTYSIEPDRLTISLEKQHHSTTWPSVFDDSITQDDENPTEEFSPHEIDAMKNVLAHMTSEEPVDNEPQASSTLLGDGMDRDELATNSSDVLVRRQTLALDRGETGAATGPFDLLSTEAPVAGRPGRAKSVVVKRQVDGLLVNSEWNHIATYPALSYVLESKRSLNLRFILHHADRFCTVIDATGSVFIYEGLSEPKASKAGQCVVQVPEVSEIVGAAVVPNLGLVILASGQLICLRGLNTKQV